MNGHVRDLRIVLPLLASMVLSTSAIAQELFKCTDGVSTTYSSTACEKLGLKPSGPIRDRLTVINNNPTPQNPSTSGRAQPSGQNQSTGEVAPPGAGNAAGTNANAASTQPQSGASAASAPPNAGKAAASIEEEEKRARRAAIGIKPVNPLIDRLAR